MISDQYAIICLKVIVQVPPLFAEDFALRAVQTFASTHMHSYFIQPELSAL